MQIRMSYKKSTPNTYVFEQVEEPGIAIAIPTLYIRKHVFQVPPVTISVEVLDELE